MIKPPIPSNEIERLRVLREYQILDTLPEELYDDIVKLAAEICNTPVALVSLVDRERQWFKARVGMEAPELPRDVSFCGHAILQDDIFEIPDARLDRRFADNPLVTGATQVTYYAGAPLKAHDGLHLGTLCVLDTKPNRLDEKQKRALAILARQVVALLNLHRNMRRVEAAKRDSEAAGRVLVTERENWMRLFDKASGFVTVFSGPNLIYEYSNPAHTRITGENPIGKRVTDYVPSEMDGTLAKIRRVYEDGKYLHIPELPLKLEGVTKYLDCNYVPRRDQAGKIDGVIAWGLDITALVEAREDLADAFASMGDGFFSLDQNWTVMNVNRRLCEIVGMNREELVERNFLKLFLDFDGAKNTRYWQEYHRAMNERVTVLFEDYYEPFNLWTLARVYPKKDGGLAVFVTDISETKQAEEALRKSEASFRSITEATPMMVWTANPTGEIQYANSKWYAYTGVKPEETLGSRYLSVIHPEDVAHTLKLLGTSIATAKPLEVEHRFRRHDGEYRWFLTRALPTFDDNGQVTRWFGTDFDIDDQRRVADELFEAKAEAERASLTKSAFLANMSHEIRTPLGAILGFTELLSDEKIDRAERARFIEVIGRNARSLTRVIDDILDLSKVEAGRLAIELSPMSISEILKDVIALFSDPNKAGDVSLSSRIMPGVPDRIRSDAVRLRQILLNIVGNALKFTEKGSVEVVVKARREDVGRGYCFTIDVIDTGRGLTQSQRDRLFQPFTQADNRTTREFGGTGLGLVLSRRLAEALGGSVDIAAFEFGKGCTFSITFSAEPIEGQEREPKSERPTEHVLDGRHILLIEDAPDNQILFETILRAAGARVTIADNGRDGVECAKSRQFDLVLMDIQMPVMDGWTAIKLLKQLDFNRPVIALTAHAMAEEKVKTRAAGFAAHVTKPIDAKELIAKIGQLLD